MPSMLSLSGGSKMPKRYLRVSQWLMSASRTVIDHIQKIDTVDTNDLSFTRVLKYAKARIAEETLVRLLGDPQDLALLHGTQDTETDLFLCSDRAMYRGVRRTVSAGRL